MRVEGLEFRVEGLEFRVESLEFKIFLDADDTNHTDILNFQSALICVICVE